MANKNVYGEYTEKDLIGKGSYGKVFTVTNKADNEVYVLKKVAFDGTSQAEADAALREAHVLSGLRHPHIVPYKEFFKADDGDLCLVMAFCEGGDLFKVIKQLKKAGKSMDELVAWQYLVQILLSLSYCHSKKILHRDVKTQNIFISNGKLMLGDFGLAKQLQRTLEMARTPIGTPYYMAPEIYEEQPYSFKSDVWALGCVMYEMLTGKPAFGAENLSKVVLRVIRGNYDPLPEHYSEALRGVVGAMLSKTVKKRPDVNDLLTHPSVTPHVQAYLDSLTQEGPAGWATWRMKLPPSFMASLALLMERAHAKESAKATGHAAAVATKAQADASSKAAADDFKAQPPKALPTKPLPPISPGAIRAGSTPSSDPLEREHVQLVHGKGPVPADNVHPGVAPVAADFAELQVLQYQIASIGAAAATPKPRSTNSVGQHAAAAIAAATASPPSAGAQLHDAAPNAHGIGASAAGSAGGKTGLPSRQAAGDARLLNGRHYAPGLEVLHASFGFDSLSDARADGTPRLPASMAAAASAYEAPDDAVALSVGQISLLESLGHRAALLRKDLKGQLGAERLSSVLAVIAQAQISAEEDMEEAVFCKEVATILGAQWSPDLYPLLEELQFLESRNKQAGKH